MVLTTTKEDFLTNHNLEIYMALRVQKKLLFQDVFETVPNLTGEFSTVISSKSAEQDIEDRVLSVPSVLGEDDDFNEIMMSPVMETSGKFIRYGFMVKWTTIMEARNNFLHTLRIQLAKAAVTMAMMRNSIILNGAIGGAKQELPTGLSDWKNNPVPREDFQAIREAYDDGSEGFELDRVFLSRNPYNLLSNYLLSFDTNNQTVDYTSTDVNGLTVLNGKDSFNQFKESELPHLKGVNFYGMSTEVPQGILEEAVDPRFSVYAATMEDNEELEIPSNFINIADYQNPNRPEEIGKFFWSSLGFNNREPSAGMIGAIQ
jgi:hypothetical protein